jgi:hypothetical protein
MGCIAVGRGLRRAQSSRSARAAARDATKGQDDVTRRGSGGAARLSSPKSSPYQSLALSGLSDIHVGLEKSRVSTDREPLFPANGKPPVEATTNH